MKGFRILIVLLMVGILATGCSHENDITAPDNQNSQYADKDGTETLGVPSITIASGSGIAEGGVGMFGLAGGAADLEITVPLGATINQVLLYWSGGSTDLIGDDTIAVNGTEVEGMLIGGPTLFYNNYNFFAYRQDITLLGEVAPGDNTVEISGFNFAGENDENNGATILVIYEDGTAANIELRDGLDLAYFEFDSPLNATVPQTYNFLPEEANRVAELVIFAGSAGLDRPNQIKVTTASGDQVFDDVLASVDGQYWDSITLEVVILADEDFLTVEVISVESQQPQGASLDWVGAGLSVPVNPPPELGCLGDFVWVDVNMDGIQDPDEMGYEGVTVYLFDCEGNELVSTVTDMYGNYMFCELEEGQYMVQFMLPGGYVFSPQDMGGDDELDSDADPATGLTMCIDLDAGENDMTWDAGIYMPVEEGCTLTIGYWKNHAGLGNGNQEDELSQYLPITLGDAGGSKSLDVTDRYIAVDVLKQKTYGRPNNGITKLYAQLLAAKLNFASGASDGAVADYVADADAFLAEHDHDDWGDLTDEEEANVMMWHGAFDDYNNGDIGPGHCVDDERDGDNDEGMNMFK